MILIIIKKEETMFANVGGIDRILRLFVGIVIFLSAFLLVDSVTWRVILAIAGTVIFFTGLTRRCLAYVPLGLDTNKSRGKAR